MPRRVIVAEQSDKALIGKGESFGRPLRLGANALMETPNQTELTNVSNSRPNMGLSIP